MAASDCLKGMQTVAATSQTTAHWQYVTSQNGSSTRSECGVWIRALSTSENDHSEGWSWINFGEVRNTDLSTLEDLPWVRHSSTCSSYPRRGKRSIKEKQQCTAAIFLKGTMHYNDLQLFTCQRLQTLRRKRFWRRFGNASENAPARRMLVPFAYMLCVPFAGRRGGFCVGLAPG